MSAASTTFVIWATTRLMGLLTALSTPSVRFASLFVIKTVGFGIKLRLQHLLDSFLDGSQYLIFLTFAFLIPVVDAFVKRPWTAQILVFLIALLSWIGLGYFYVSASALLVAGLLQALLLVSIYRNYGLLAVIVTMMSAQAALSAATLITQPLASLQSSGWKAIAGLGVASIVALFALFKSAEVKEEEVAVEARGEDRAKRERLQAEFSVARRAQQHMLPDAPPRAPDDL